MLGNYAGPRGGVFSFKFSVFSESEGGVPRRPGLNAECGLWNVAATFTPTSDVGVIVAL
jgi:hypothetical protein